MGYSLPSSAVVVTLTNWTPYTPAAPGLTLGNGTLEFFQRQEGDSIRISGALTVGSTTSLAGILKIGLPAGLTGDTTKMAESGVLAHGGGRFQQTGTGPQPEMYARFDSVTNAVFLEGRSSANTMGQVSASFPVAWASGYVIEFADILVPVR